nr:hypothetical protein [Tanacetum cinerariifolium]
MPYVQNTKSYSLQEGIHYWIRYLLPGVVPVTKDKIQHQNVISIISLYLIYRDVVGTGWTACR